MEFFNNSVFFGVMLSLLAYGIGALLKQKFKLAIFNPLLIAVIIVIAVLAVSGIDYKVYNEGAKYISYLLTPATICLAIPLYEQFELLKSNWKAISGRYFQWCTCKPWKYSCHGSPIWIYASGICIISSKIYYNCDWNGGIRRTWRIRFHHRCYHRINRCTGKYVCRKRM